MDCQTDRPLLADPTPTRTSASPRPRAATPNSRPTAAGQRCEPTLSRRSTWAARMT